MSSSFKHFCAICGKEFTPSGGRQKACSPECATEYAKRYNKAYREKQRRLKGLEPLENRTCIRCGCKFDATRNFQHRCNACVVADQKTRMKEYNRAYKKKHRQELRKKRIPAWLHTTSRSIPLLKKGFTVEQILKFRHGDEPSVEDVLRMPETWREKYSKGWMQSEKGAALAVLDGTAAM